MKHVDRMERRSLVREIEGMLPQPFEHQDNLDGEAVWIGGDPGEVIVRMSDTQIAVSVYTMLWGSPHTMTVLPVPLGVLDWGNVPAAQMSMLLQILVGSASDLRKSSYRNCETCDQLNPPEWMHDENICQSCAQTHLGIVY
ncbi:MAG: hypothetical protein IT422_22495 [Pirellulaceae bacterium]|nr:hypothetical protein [Pirellulaceae bacterium]